MHRTVGGVLLLLLALPAMGAADDPKDKPATPAEQYQALVKEHAQAQADFFKAYGDAPDEDKPKLLKEKYPDFGPKFLALAEKNAEDPAALDALLWVASNRGRTPDKDDSLAKALEILLKDHVQSEKLGAVCERLVYSNSEGSAKAFLLAVLEKSPHKDVQSEACLTLAQRALQRAAMIGEIKKDPESFKQLSQTYGKEYVDALQKDDVGKLNAEGEKYYRRFADNYAAEVTAQRLVRLCSRMGFSTDTASERLLRALLEKDTRPEVQGVAILFLAKILWRRAEALPEADAKEAAKLLKDSEDLFEQAAARYADVKLPPNGTVGKKAKTELYSLRNLSVGKLAPDIQAEDQDGKKFKLSDYRGKVVLLDFWSQH